MSVFRIRHKKLGGHVHMRVFSAPRAGATFAKLGDLCCDEAEFKELRDAMAHVEFLTDDDDSYPYPARGDQVRLAPDGATKASQS